MSVPIFLFFVFWSLKAVLLIIHLLFLPIGTGEESVTVLSVVKSHFLQDTSPYKCRNNNSVLSNEMNDDAGSIPSDLDPRPDIVPPLSENSSGISIRPVTSDNGPVVDSRLYVPNHEDWGVEIKRDSERIYCYSKQPGQDWFHLILNGEIYVTRQHERYCLSCALRMGFLTQDRLFWQHRVPKRPTRVL